MKKIKFLIVALFAILVCANLSSCSKDDDEPKGNGNYSLVGKWIDEEGTIYEFLNDNTFKEYYDIEEYPNSYDYGKWKLSSPYLLMTYMGHMDYGYDEPDDYNSTWTTEIKWIDKESFLMSEDGWTVKVKRF